MVREDNTTVTTSVTPVYELKDGIPTLSESKFNRMYGKRCVNNYALPHGLWQEKILKK
jgi:hypothetical protein